jgi:hypothetical protein
MKRRLKWTDERRGSRRQIVMKSECHIHQKRRIVIPSIPTTNEKKRKRKQSARSITAFRHLSLDVTEIVDAKRGARDAELLERE